MNWIQSLTTVEGAKQELAAFDITLRGPIWALLVQRIVVETPVILLTREALRSSCVEFCEDPNAFHRALERHRRGSSELPSGAHAYITNPEQKSEATRSRTGAYPMSCYFVFVLLPRIVKRRGTYDRQQFFVDFPRDLVSEDTLEKVWSIWEAHARAGRFGLTWDAGGLRDQKYAPVFDYLFTAAPHQPSHFEIVRDDLYMNGESHIMEISSRTGLAPQDILQVVADHGPRAKDRTKRYFVDRTIVDNTIGFTPLSMREVVLDQAKLCTREFSFTCSDLAWRTRANPKSTILKNALSTLVKDKSLTVDKSIRPYRYSLARP